jgi:TRAP-type uncharacterized transport system substrate-binding protein
MSEHRVLALSLLGAAAALLPGHSPYRQWYAYRAKHLVVVTDEERPGAFTVAAAVAAAIVVKLLSSGQLQVGLIPAVEALEAFEGRGRFADDGKVPLRAVAVLGGDLLVVLESCDRQRAHEMAQALAESRDGVPLAEKPSLRGPTPIPFHPGALDYFEGRTAPKGG